ncbi:MAG: 1-deoxy-D-xylulose-5-phosphate synthase [Firmicutes bacterium]|jgi:1-deoxy-D-xylulose-5-phosphate synthase|nr:1-deoxy-D-xylulose-5-phosphate synthase [Bacillota bacterium]
MKSILASVKSPADLKSLSATELKELADEIRQTIVATVAANGGHLAPNLGVVELTIALHLALDSPRDQIVWDVGHQCYAHKLLTGRWERFSTLRTAGGISGFPDPTESEHDAFYTGHSSTSISAALGMAVARDRTGGRGTVVAVIGDGALAGGMAFEALNHAGQGETDLIVVLNDNEMSISRSVGALASHLGSIRTRARRRGISNALRRMAEAVPIFGQQFRALGHRIKRGIKSVLIRGMLFEELGFMYIGPIDGHNIRAIKRAIEDAKAVGGPVLVHVVTTKGKGYAPAESNPELFHGTAPFDVSTGVPAGAVAGATAGAAAPDGPPTFTSAFGRCITAAARRDPRIMAVCAAMADGTGLAGFARAYPERFFDVGIAEEHAVTFAAGMASRGLRPVVAVYSTFLQRAYDQIIHDVALGRLPVILAVDRAGIVGEDGRTHQGAFDISFLRDAPGMTVMAPADDLELEAMFDCALAHDGPCAIRYPKAAVERVAAPREAAPVRIGRAQLLREGKHATIAALGPMVQRALEASRILSSHGVSCAVINARFAKPVDAELILEHASKTGVLITVEDGIASGGFGSALAQAMHAEGLDGIALISLGIPDRFIEHGRRDEILASLGLDAQGIAAAVHAALKERRARDAGSR